MEARTFHTQTRVASDEAQKAGRAQHRVPLMRRHLLVLRLQLLFQVTRIRTLPHFLQSHKLGTFAAG